MRRLLSILLVLLLGFSAASPLLALTSADASRLPACCRRLGRHCTGLMAGDGTSSAGGNGVVVHAKAQPCPFCPASVQAPHTDSAALLAASVGAPHSDLAGTLVRRPVSVRYAIADRAWPKRGPPTFDIL